MRHEEPPNSAPSISFDENWLFRRSAACLFYAVCPPAPLPLADQVVLRLAAGAWRASNLRLQAYDTMQTQKFNLSFNRLQKMHNTSNINGKFEFRGLKRKLAYGIP
jgi:hypothetical protein